MKAVNLDIKCDRKRSLKRGAMLLETLLGVFILSLAAVGFYALTPVIFRSRSLAKENTAALQMANRLLEHVELLKTSDLTPATLTSLNLIDTGQSAPPYSFSHIPLDEASRYSPAQVLRDGTGTMTITPLDSGAVRVNVQVSWTSSSGKAATVQTGTIIGGYK